MARTSNATASRGGRGRAEGSDNRSGERQSSSKELQGSCQSPSIAADLSYSEAQSALELALAQLQAPDLPVEEMSGLYQRAQAYAQRCEELLESIEQTIELWDPQDGTTTPFNNT